MTLNRDQILSLIRMGMTMLGTVLVSTGTVTAEHWQTWTLVATEITGTACIVVPMIWSLVVHSRAGKVAAVAAMPETAVTPAGDILIKDTKLREVARDAATLPTADNLP